MTEYDILYLYGERFNSLWGIIQFWSSVSFGYLALGIVVVKRLNIVTIVVLSVLYLAFSLHVLGALESVYSEIQSFQIAMSELKASLGNLSTAGNAIIIDSGSKFESFAARAAFYGTFLVSIVSLPYQYYKTNKKSNVD